MLCIVLFLSEDIAIALPVVTDIASSKGAATAIGVTGVFGYAGAALSGVGTGYFVDRYGWAGGFGFWIGAALIGAAVGIPLWRVGLGTVVKNQTNDARII